MKMLKTITELDGKVYKALFGIPKEVSFIGSDGLHMSDGNTPPLFLVEKVVSISEIEREFQEKIESLKEDAAFQKNLSDLLQAKEDQIKFVKEQNYEAAARTRDEMIPKLKKELAGRLGLSLYGVNKLNFD